MHRFVGGTWQRLVTYVVECLVRAKQMRAIGAEPIDAAFSNFFTFARYYPEPNYWKTLNISFCFIYYSNFTRGIG